MPPGFKLPRLYAIIDAGCFAPGVGKNNVGGVTKGGAAPLSEGKGGWKDTPPLSSLGSIGDATSHAPIDQPGAAGTPDKARPRWDNAPYQSESASAHHTLLRIIDYAGGLVAAGVTLMQYRNKFGTTREVPSHARELKRALPGSVTLFLNDRADLCLAAGFDGVHVGQGDLSPAAARLVVGDKKLVGVSTHNAPQLQEADQAPVDYIAIGPIFSTRSKANPDPEVGLDGLRTVRKLTTKPLVAIGGITRANCRAVIDAGADSVAMIADLLDDPRKRAEEFLGLLDR